ncbi:MAG: hypothetical protein RMH97_02855 [Verrucomicrobiales bacterium]|nr:hypothetical protein [Verrucomicrobiales bacterium]
MKNQSIIRQQAVRRIRRAFVSLCAGALFLACVQAQVPLPIYEPFPLSYTNSPSESTPVPAGGPVYPALRLGAGPSATLWSLGNSPGGGSAVIVGGPAALSYPGLYAGDQPSLGLFIRTNDTTANRTRGILFPAVSEGSLYVSFLLNVVQWPSTNGTVSPYNRLLVKLDALNTPSNSTGTENMAGVWITTNRTVGISKRSNSLIGAETTSTLPDGTHLIVLRYKFNPGDGDDEVALWLDPPQASLGVAEENVPEPTLTITGGTDVPSLSSLLIYHIGTEVVVSAFLDEFRIATNWAQVTPTQALCVPATISVHPTNQTVNEGVAAILSVIAGGSAPAFQWQYSTNNGLSWFNVTDGIGATSQTYWTRPLTRADNGIQYRVVVSVACSGGSAATSSVATITVVPAVPTPPGVVVDDEFNDYSYNNLPYGISNSVWFTGTAGALDAGSGEYILATVPSSTVNWLGFFTDDSVNLPVHLEVGRTIRAALWFKARDIVASNGSVRIGLFSYADGATRPTTDGFGNNTRGQNVRGYMVALNFGTNFSGAPFAFYARNNLAGSDLMWTIADYLALGSGPAGMAGQPAFQNETMYVFELSVTRRATTAVDITAKVTGGGTNWAHTVTDTNYLYPRFDCLAIRCGGAAASASQFEFHRFLVEVTEPAPQPVPLSVVFSGGNITLTWSNPAFKLQAAPAVTGPYTNVPGAVSPFVVPANAPQMFYRLVWP